MNRIVRIVLKAVIPFFLLATIIVLVSIRVLDRTPYREMSFYERMNLVLDSLDQSVQFEVDTAKLDVGWAVGNITPPEPVPLAGYGSRSDMNYEEVHDSSYVRVVVLQQGSQKVAIVGVDLLIIHPELYEAVVELLPANWNAENLYFTASHTHSGQGGWAPGLVGELFAGDYNPKRVDFLANKFIGAIVEAEQNLQTATFSSGEFKNGSLVQNRLVGSEGEIDPWVKVLLFSRDSGTGIFSFYSAHATCFGSDFKALSGDYPYSLVTLIEAFDGVEFAAFGAGAVGSMKPKPKSSSGEKNIENVAYHLANEIALFRLIQMGTQESYPLASWSVPLFLREPQVKITENLALRPYLFDYLFGEYSQRLSVLIIGKTLLIGLPFDFSGELALPLYEQARELGWNLVLSSFNGGYLGYVVKDEWYDLPAYEARTMSWCGHDCGAYLSEVIERILLSIDEHYHTDISD